MANEWVFTTGDADDLALLPEEGRTVIGLLRRLPPAQRLVMAWYFDGYGPAEIAAILDKRPETVRSALRHARLRLRRELTGSLLTPHEPTMPAILRTSPLTRAPSPRM